MLFGLDKKKILGISIATIAVIVLVVVIVVLSNKSKNEKLKAECEKRKGKWNDKDKKCEFPDPTETGGETVAGEGSYDPTGSTGTGIQWSPNALAGEIKSEIEGYNWYCKYSTSEKILELTDPQLKALYSYYNANEAEEFPTLTQLFDNEYSAHCAYDPKYKDVVKRLKGLGLY
jgi:hypothetical protein